MKLNFLQSLIDNDSISLHQSATDWKQAVKFSIDPLIKAKVVKPEYLQGIYDNAKENGPYFVVSDDVAIPHASAASGALQNGFSLVTLDKPVQFDNDDRKIRLLIGFAAISPDVHVGAALPQIVALIEDPKNVKALLSANSKQEVIDLISQIDLNKYLNN